MHARRRAQSHICRGVHKIKGRLSEQKSCAQQSFTKSSMYALKAVHLHIPFDDGKECISCKHGCLVRDGINNLVTTAHGTHTRGHRREELFAAYQDD